MITTDVSLGFPLKIQTMYINRNISIAYRLPKTISEKKNDNKWKKNFYSERWFPLLGADISRNENQYPN